MDTEHVVLEPPVRHNHQRKAIAMKTLIKRTVETIGALAISALPITGWIATAEATNAGAATAVAAPANTTADHAVPTHLGHHDWIINNEVGFGQQAQAPRVDTSVRGGQDDSGHIRSVTTR